MRGALTHALRRDPLIAAPEISRRVSLMGREISRDYAGTELVFVVILKGAFVFAGDLLRTLDPDIRARVEFAYASSYGDATVSSGSVHLASSGVGEIQGRDVLIVEDIIDTGRTIRALTSQFHSLGARTVEIAALLVKNRRAPSEINAKYVGFSVPDVFVVGYGLDYAQDYRQLPDIRILARQ